MALFVVLRWQDVLELEPNALGDFFAGSFAPLAFLWLVLGFFQQGAELRNSGQALWLQGEELRHSVEQQRQLVEVTREQLKFEADCLATESDRLADERERRRRIAEPRLELISQWTTKTSDGRRQHSFSLANHGKTCTRVVVKIDGGREVKRADTLEAGKRIDVTFSMSPEDGDHEMTVDYLNDDREPGMARMSFTSVGGNTYVL